MRHSPRYRIMLVEDPGEAVVARPRSDELPEEAHVPDYLPPLTALLSAIRRLSPRGPGPEGWSLSLSDDPVAFLLSSTSDAVLVRAEQGKVLYSNQRAHAIGLVERSFTTYERFTVEGTSFERRGMRLELPDGVLTFEIATQRG